MRKDSIVESCRTDLVHRRNPHLDILTLSTLPTAPFDDRRLEDSIDVQAGQRKMGNHHLLLGASTQFLVNGRLDASTLLLRTLARTTRSKGRTSRRKRRVTGGGRETGISLTSMRPIPTTKRFSVCIYSSENMTTLRWTHKHWIHAVVGSWYDRHTTPKRIGV